MLDTDPKFKAWLFEQCPIAFTVHEASAQLLSTHVNLLVLVAECRISDPATITTEPSPIGIFTESPDGERVPYPAIVCPEIDLLELRAEEICGALSLLLQTAIGCGPLIGMDEPGLSNALVRENADDEALFVRLERPMVNPPLRRSATETTLGTFAFSGELVSQLAERPGTRLYWEAQQHIHSPVARFRELWRTLELSFGAQGRTLRNLLLAFPPVLELGFDADELTDYEVLRGRASHASNRLGHLEAATVHRLAMQRVGRLQALVDRVLLAKGGDAGDLVVDQLVPFREDMPPANFNRLHEDPVRR